MFHSRRFRIGLAAITASACLGGVAWTATSAQATTLSVKCTSLSGTYMAPSSTLSGCTGNTGGSGTVTAPSTGVALITWANGKTTTTSGTNCNVSTSGENCDHGDKILPETAATQCPAGTVEGELFGKVTADTTGSVTVGAKAKTEVCVNTTTLALSLEPGTKAKI
jgi:hypothetical protein